MGLCAKIQNSKLQNLLSSFFKQERESRRKMIHHCSPLTRAAPEICVLEKIWREGKVRAAFFLT
jgi:hypothetical protein